VVAALDDWASIAGDGPRRAWLLAVVRATDPDPERDQLRQPELWRDGAALARLARQAKVDESSPQLAAALGRTLLANGGDAIPLLRKAQAQHPCDFWLNVLLAVALHEARQWDQAIGYFRAALALRPVGPVHTSLGLALYEKRQLDEAIGHYEEALRLDPNSAPAHNNIGLALYEKGQLDEAISHYEKALRIEVTSLAAHYNLANALRKQNQLDKAIKEYRAAIELDPKYPAGAPFPPPAHRTGQPRQSPG
jgi:tetratricopeptide (TPR) repeat protein